MYANYNVSGNYLSASSIPGYVNPGKAGGTGSINWNNVNNQRDWDIAHHEFEGLGGFYPYEELVSSNSRDQNLENTRMVGQGASYFSGALGLGYMGLRENRLSLGLHQRINTSARFYPAIRGVGMASRYFGYAGNAGAGLGFIMDTKAYADGEISLERYGYRTTGLGLSIGVGAAIGGPPGAAAGAGVGGVWSGAEYIYDSMLVPLWNQTINQIGNFESAIKNGWYPGR